MIINFIDGTGGSGSGYTLPIATSSVLGGVMIGSGITIDTAGTISADVAQDLSGLFAGVEYDSSATSINFYDREGTLVGQVDASSFVIDGMIEDVYITGSTMVIEFNTEAGKQDIEIDLTDIFNPANYYTKAEVDAEITGATSPIQSQVDDIERVTATAYTELHTDIVALSGATQDMATQTWVNSQNFVDDSDLATAMATETARTESTYLKSVPTATTNDFGVVKIGSGITVTNGVISVDGSTPVPSDTTILNPVMELPASAETGSVVAGIRRVTPFGNWENENLEGTTWIFHGNPDYPGVLDQEIELTSFEVNQPWMYSTPIYVIGRYNSDAWLFYLKYKNSGSDIWQYTQLYQDFTFQVSDTDYYYIVQYEYEPLSFTVKKYETNWFNGVAYDGRFYGDPEADGLYQYFQDGWKPAYTLSPATDQALGGIKASPYYTEASSIWIDNDGFLTVNGSAVDEVNSMRAMGEGREMNENTVAVIPTPPYTGIATFNINDLVDNYGEDEGVELFGMTSTDDRFNSQQGDYHLHIYYNKEEEQDPYFTLDDLDETGENPTFDNTDGTTAFTFNPESSAYTIVATVTVDSGDVRVEVTYHNNDEDKDMWVGSWTDDPDHIHINWGGYTLSQAHYVWDDDLGDNVLAPIKYYNEENIHEVTGQMVKSLDVRRIIPITQAQYDAMAQAGTLDANTLYLITNANA